MGPELLVEEENFSVNDYVLVDTDILRGENFSKEIEIKKGHIYVLYAGN